MIMREIDLKCLLSSDPEVQLKGLSWLTYQITQYALVPDQSTLGLLRGLSQMDAALCRFVDFLSHENSEVSETVPFSLSLRVPHSPCLVLSWDGLL
jgi:hypothetical protein